MKLFSKGFAFIPLLVVLFLLIISAVTSYVVINQGTGGYKSRADGSTCSQFRCVKGMQGSNIVCTVASRTYCHVVRTGISGRFYDCVAKDEYSQTRYGTIAYHSCRASAPVKLANGNQCSGNTNCISNYCNSGRCMPVPTATPTPRQNTCSTGPTNTCGYLRKGGCPDGVVYCTGSTCIDPNTGVGPAEGRTGKCVSTSSTASCPGGILCRDNQPIVGTVNQVVCGLNNVAYKCSTTGAWVLGPAGSCSSTTVGYCSTGGGGGGGGGGTAVTPTEVPPTEVPPTNNASCADGILCDGTPVTGSAGETVCGQKDTGGTCRTSQCNGSTGKWDYVGEACNVETPPSTTGDATLAFTLKFQGVTGNPRGGKTVPFKVKLRGPSDTDYATGTLTADSSGLWKGSVSFSGINTGSGYTVFVKAGKHFQKRVCDSVPTEVSGGLYNCSNGATTISSGVNSLDFSGIFMLVGDLPSASGVQSGTADSYDKTFIVNNFGSTTPDELKIGDLNFDGVIDTQDRSLITQSLNVKYDDE